MGKIVYLCSSSLAYKHWWEFWKPEFDKPHKVKLERNKAEDLIMKLRNGSYAKYWIEEGSK